VLWTKAGRADELQLLAGASAGARGNKAEAVRHERAWKHSAVLVAGQGLGRGGRARGGREGREEGDSSGCGSDLLPCTMSRFSRDKLPVLLKFKKKICKILKRQAGRLSKER
jgi:hypothetical protein